MVFALFVFFCRKCACRPRRCLFLQKIAFATTQKRGAQSFHHFAQMHAPCDRFFHMTASRSARRCSLPSLPFTLQVASIHEFQFPASPTADASRNVIPMVEQQHAGGCPGQTEGKALTLLLPALSSSGGTNNEFWNSQNSDT